METLVKIILLFTLTTIIILLLLALTAIIVVVVGFIEENLQKHKNPKEINKMDEFKKIKVKFKDNTKFCLIETNQYNSNNCYVININGEIGEIDFNYQYKEQVHRSLFVDVVRPLSLDDILNLRSDKDITTKQELVKLIKRDFRDEDGVIDLNGLDFSGETVVINQMKAKELFQNGQEVEGSLHQGYQTVGNNLYQQYQEVGNSLYQQYQKVGLDLYQQNQEVKGEIFQGETNRPTDQQTKKDQDEANTDQDETKKDNINPNYYKGKIECIDAIEEITKDLQGIEAVDTGMAIKYLWRWKNKNGVEDLKKAQWYINHLIEINETKSKPKIDLFNLKEE